MDRETIYLYGGENQPQVKLTLVQEFTKILPLINYFHAIQDAFLVEFETTETITQNLKLRCVSYGDGGTPFYILEYDNVLDKFYVWQSDGKWEMNRLIAALYTDLHGNHTASLHLLKSDPRFLNHPKRSALESAVDRLHVDWSKVDLDCFWSQFEDVCDSSEPEFSCKSLVSMAVLRTKVKHNKESLARSLQSYHTKMNNHFTLTAGDLSSFDLDAVSPRKLNKLNKRKGSTVPRRRSGRISKIKG